MSRTVKQKIRKVYHHCSCWWCSPETRQRKRDRDLNKLEHKEQLDSVRDE